MEEETRYCFISPEEFDAARDVQGHRSSAAAILWNTQRDYYMGDGGGNLPFYKGSQAYNLLYGIATGRLIVRELQ